MRKRAADYAVNSICVARGPVVSTQLAPWTLHRRSRGAASSLAPPEAIAPLLGADSGPRSEGP